MAAHTYTVVFVGTLVDASGIPFPGRLLLVAAGALAAAVFVESAPRPRCAAEEMLRLLHSAPPGQSQN